MPLLSTKAIVIRNQILGEADKIVTFYTLKSGKVRLVVKGARRTKNRYGGCLELLSYGDLVFFHRLNKDLHSINSFDISESFFQLREDLEKIACCSYAVELIDKSLQEGQPDVELFELLHLTLSAMKNAPDPELLLRAFEIQLLTLAGFEPQLEVCLKCEADLGSVQATGSARVGFSNKLGGVVCHNCKHKDPNSSVIFRGTLELMKSLKKLAPELAIRLRTTEQVKGELRTILGGFTVYHIGQRLKSEKFIETLTSRRGNIF